MTVRPTHCAFCSEPFRARDGYVEFWRTSDGGQLLFRVLRRRRRGSAIPKATRRSSRSSCCPIVSITQVFPIVNLPARG